MLADIQQTEITMDDKINEIMATIATQEKKKETDSTSNSEKMEMDEYWKSKKENFEESYPMTRCQLCIRVLVVL